MVKIISVIIGILWTSLVSKFQAPKAHVQVGAYTYGNPNFVSFLKTDKVTIGKFCSIADDVTIITSGEHAQHRVSTQPIKGRVSFIKGEESLSKGPITIGNDVWIGTSVLILSNVKIGDGVIIGAGSVVTKDIPSYAIAVGNPARVIRYRFNPDQIRKLLDIAWWNWSIEKIRENVGYFYEDVDRFIERFWENRESQKK